MYNIAISYRRIDTEGTVGRMFDFLEQHYGVGSVFIDVSNVPFGTDFRAHITDAISRSGCLLVVMGANWLVTDEQGRSRIMMDDDLVHVEIHTAMSLKVPIIPILVGSSPMPGPHDLPQDIQDFSFINAAPIDPGRDFRADITRLVNSINKVIVPRQQKGRLQSDSQSFEQVGDKEDIDDTEFLSSEEMGEALTRLGSRQTLAGRFESFVITRGPVELCIAAVALGLLLSFLSQTFGLGWLTYKRDDGINKQVGFLFAPNWTFVYILLFPPYLALFSVFVSRANYVLRRLIGKRKSFITKTPQDANYTVLERWSQSLKMMSVFFWIVVVAVTMQALSEWWIYCYTPLRSGIIGSASIDWIKLNVVDPNQAGWWQSVIFSAIAYSYMAFALFLYLVVLIYFAFFAGFLNRLSYGRDSLVETRELNVMLSMIMTPVYICVMLGLGAAVCMRVQAEYIKSQYSVITEFVFSDIGSIIGLVSGLKQNTPPPRPMHIPSEWTSFGELVFTLLVLFLVLYLVYDTFERARRHRVKVDRRLGHKPKPDFEPSFLEAVIPQSRQFHLILAGEVLTYFFTGYGLIGIATIAYATFQLFLGPKFDKKTGRDTAVKVCQSSVYEQADGE